MNSAKDCKEAIQIENVFVLQTRAKVEFTEATKNGWEKHINFQESHSSLPAIHCHLHGVRHQYYYPPIRTAISQDGQFNKR